MVLGLWPNHCLNIQLGDSLGTRSASHLPVYPWHLAQGLEHIDTSRMVNRYILSCSLSFRCISGTPYKFYVSGFYRRVGQVSSNHPAFLNLSHY